MQEVRSSLTDNGHKVPAKIDLTHSEHAAITAEFTILILTASLALTVTKLE